MFILGVNSYGNPFLLDEQALSAYILSYSDIQELNSLRSDSMKLVNSLSAELMAKTGPGMVSKNNLDSIYVRVKNNSGLTKTDLSNYYKYILSNLVGHNIVDTSELIPDSINLEDVMEGYSKPIIDDDNPFDSDLSDILDEFN